MDEDGYFGERVAARHDESTADMSEPGVVESAVSLLAGLAGGGRALELGIGTGRIALPLARRGVPVRGIDLSRAMVARLRAKPGGDAIGVTIGDFATTTVGSGSFSVAYLVFNTIMNLTTQEAQVACFRKTTSEVTGGRGEYRSIPFRYVWPAELDLMAQLAGMRLRERWAGWAHEPFTSGSRQHVSIWDKPAY